MNLFHNIATSIKKHGHLPAFYIDDRHYTYDELASRISSIRHCITTELIATEKNIGLVANDDLETYAAIIGLWLEGKSYVPVNPAVPEERNGFIMREAGVKTMLDSSNRMSFNGCRMIDISALPPATVNLQPAACADHELVYILFTSGTTGVPKGVAITRANLAAFIDGFNVLVPSINTDDRWLQMFDLTFDLSVMSYLAPLLAGACVYTIPTGKIKYNYIFKLMDEQKLTGALMVPSVIHYLRPFFEEINAVEMKYSLFCGEALHGSLAEEWSRCIPNAAIMNVYGPTENTIFCTAYNFDRNGKNKSYKDVLSIGKNMKDCFTIIVDENNKPLAAGEKGELCLGGMQLSPGYWNNEERNKTAFFNEMYKGKYERFYKTGDLCIQDEDGDILYIGRTDAQVKIQGFRVELLEVEFYAKQFLENTAVVATTFVNAIGNNDIGLIIESKSFDCIPLIDHLKKNLPSYMIPSGIMFKETFPYTAHGKIDRNRLNQFFHGNEE